jgi:hypothetical protein
LGVFNRFPAEIAAQQGVSINNIDWSRVSSGQAWRVAEDQFAAAGTPGIIIDEYFSQMEYICSRAR